MSENAYNRDNLVSSLRSAIEGARLGTSEIRNLIDARESNMDLVAVELTSVFYELGFSDENKDFFNGSFRSMLRNALKKYGAYRVKVSYKRTRDYQAGDRELSPDDSGNWYWHVEITISAVTKSDEDYQALADSTEVVGEPHVYTETELALNKVLESEKIDRVEAAQVLLGSLSGPAGAFVVQKYLEAANLTSIRDIRKKAEIERESPSMVQAAS